MCEVFPFELVRCTREVIHGRRDRVERIIGAFHGRVSGHIYISVGEGSKAARGEGGAQVGEEGGFHVYPILDKVLSHIFGNLTKVAPCLLRDCLCNNPRRPLQR